MRGVTAATGFMRTPQNGKGYGVVKLLIGGSLAELSEIRATVQESKGIDVLLRPASPAEHAITITLPVHGRPV